LSVAGPPQDAKGAKNLVLDTNIVLDLFVFDDRNTRVLKDELAQRAWRWIATMPMRAELEHVLDYSHLAERLTFYGLRASEVLERFDSSAEMVDVAATAPAACRDPDDQKFIDLAVAHGAVLLSKDAAVLAMRNKLAALGVEASAMRRTGEG
jgi:putative PIN family toxin of toxin-antitoxin system